MAKARPGTLIAIGGAEDKTGEMHILRRVLALTTGHSPRVEIMPTASGEPIAAASAYLQAFARLGIHDVGVLPVRTPQDGAQESYVDRIRRADLVYLTGGDQLRLTTALHGTRVLAALREKLRAGGVIAGSSAGAAAMSRTMIARGEARLRKGNAQMAVGFGLLPGVIVDTHFAERGRFGRLIEAVAARPGLLGVGLGEDTAIIVRGDEVEVVGAGSVVLVDAREMRSSNVGEAAQDQPVSVDRMILHTLSHGARFHLDQRRVAPLVKTG